MVSYFPENQLQVFWRKISNRPIPFFLFVGLENTIAISLCLNVVGLGNLQTAVSQVANNKLGCNLDNFGENARLVVCKHQVWCADEFVALFVYLSLASLGLRNDREWELRARLLHLDDWTQTDLPLLLLICTVLNTDDYIHILVAHDELVFCQGSRCWQRLLGLEVSLFLVDLQKREDGQSFTQDHNMGEKTQLKSCVEIAFS